MLGASPQDKTYSSFGIFQCLSCKVCLLHVEGLIPQVVKLIFISGNGKNCVKIAFIYTKSLNLISHTSKHVLNKD